MPSRSKKYTKLGSSNEGDEGGGVEIGQVAFSIEDDDGIKDNRHTNGHSQGPFNSVPTPIPPAPMKVRRGEKERREHRRKAYQPQRITLTTP